MSPTSKTFLRIMLAEQSVLPHRPGGIATSSGSSASCFVGILWLYFCCKESQGKRKFIIILIHFLFVGSTVGDRCLVVHSDLVCVDVCVRVVIMSL